VRVLGIDPGSRVAGYGCVDASRADPVLVEAGVFRLGESKTPLAERLVALETDLTETIGRLRPDRVAVESVFSHAGWPASAITMAHARGVVLLAAKKAGASLVELPPAEIKKALTGGGNATKAQVREAVARALRPAEPLEPADVSDALAAALAASWRRAGAGAPLHSAS